MPKSMTLDDLEQSKRTLAAEKSFYGGHQKNLNEDRPILSAAKCIGRWFQFLAIWSLWVPYI